MANVGRVGNKARLPMLHDQPHKSLKVLPGANLFIEAADVDKMLARTKYLISDEIVLEQVMITDAGLPVSGNRRGDAVGHQAFGKQAGNRDGAGFLCLPFRYEQFDAVSSKLVIVVETRDEAA